MDSRLRGNERNALSTAAQYYCFSSPRISTKACETGSDIGKMLTRTRYLSDILLKLNNSRWAKRLADEDETPAADTLKNLLTTQSFVPIAY
jgi:hypothetical protein